MIDKLKQEAMRRGMKLMSNPKFMKLMADPRVMGAITQGFALRGKIQSEIDSKIRSVACALNLATKEEVQTLQRSMQKMQSTVDNLHVTPKEN